MHPTRALTPGDRLAVVAPASPFTREEFDRGVDELRRLGFEPVYDESVFARQRYVWFALKDPRGCGSVRLTVQYDGRVAGRVMTRAGIGIPGLGLELVSEKRSQPDANAAGAIHARTDDDGRFDSVVKPSSNPVPNAAPRKTLACRP